MKHNFKFYAAIVCSTIALASCSSEAIEDTKTTGKQHMTITAQQETNVNSRTSLGSDLSVLWANGDALSVLDGTDNNAFELVSGAGASSAQFNGSATSTDTYYAVYPYQESVSLDASTIKNVEIPATQTATANTFDPKANIMTAVATGSTNFQFKNVCSYASITTPAPCKKITFTAGASDKIAGKFDMNIGADGIATTTATANSVNSVTLIPSNGDTFAAGTYYIAIAAGNMSALKVECEYADKTVYQSIQSSISIFTRGSIIDMEEACIENGWNPCCYCPDENHPHYIDLGLPSGLKWSCMNVGAHHPEEYGDYFAWAATKPWYTEGHAYDNPCTSWIDGKTGYDWVSAPYQTANATNENSERWSKYLGSTTSKYKDPSATNADALKTVLDPEDDAAHINWGGTWRMPTNAEQKELYNNCYWVWTNSYNRTGRKGYIVYKAKTVSDKGIKVCDSSTPSINYTLSDIHIFLPAAGFRQYNTLNYCRSIGYYLSSSLREDMPCHALSIMIASNILYDDVFYNRTNGLSVRAVCP